MRYRAAKLIRRLLRKGRVTPVAQLERRDKAVMIAKILADFRGEPLHGLRVLDIGAGNGDIAQHFATLGNRVVGVDALDQRKPGRDGFRFLRVDSETIPLESRSMDVVISNQVIEHVLDQRLHLSEIKRVLDVNGMVYMATPNDRSPLMRGHVNNPHVLGYPEMKRLFEDHGFEVHEYSSAIVTDPQRFGAPTTAFRRLPKPWVPALRNWFPSHVFVLTQGEV